MRVLIHTFGCQMNKLDSDLVAEALDAAGHEITENEEEAEAILFNTCSVRDHAEERVIQRVRQLRQRKREQPGLRLGILGCMAQRRGAELFDLLPELDLVCGTRQFPHIARWIGEDGPVLAVDEDSLTAPGAKTPHERTRHSGLHGYISIMRGCNNFCAYCIVPYVRGREESRPADAIVDEARALAGKGAKEITLLGQNIDAYGKDIGNSLGALLHRLHEELPEVLRWRFVTSHPRDIHDDLVRTLHELPRISTHLHMPAQSGSTRVLQAMRRGYSREDYDRKLRMIKDIAPEALVTSDFIMGFPTETAEEFEETLELVQQAGFLNIYAFKYSPRPGTLSAREMDDDVPAEEKQRRLQALLDAQTAVAAARAETLIGTTQEILVEGVSARDERRLIGRTPSGLNVVFEHTAPPETYAGTLQHIRITHGTPLTLHGEIATR